MLRAILLSLSLFVIAGLFFAASPGHSLSWSLGYAMGAVLGSILIGIGLHKALPKRKE